MIRKASHWVIAGGLAAGGITLLTNPKLLHHPSQICKASLRLLRCVGYAGVIAASYKREISDRTHRKNARRMYDCFVKNGGLYIKLGQILSQLSFLVPRIYQEEMERCCVDCPESSFDAVKGVVEEELGSPLDSLFADFERQPIASASLAQVHKAKLKESGEVVAVKVQHRWFREHYPGDLALVRFCVNVGEKLFPTFKYKWLAREVAHEIPLELDFINEAENCQQLGQIFKNNPHLKVPKIYPKYSTSRVLTMSYEEGIPLTNIEGIIRTGVDISKVMKEFTLAYCKQIFKHGFVHCDPHPGNILVRVKPGTRDTPEIVFLDHGLYERLSDDTRMNFAFLWRSIILQEKKNISKYSRALGTDLHKLFASMLLNRRWEDLIQPDKKYEFESRLATAKTQEKRDEVKRLSMQYVQEITLVLGGVRREVILLFKTAEFQKNIEQKFGHPESSYEQIFLYSSKGVRKYGNLGLTQNVREWWKDMKVRFFFALMRIMMLFRRILGMV